MRPLALVVTSLLLAGPAAAKPTLLVAPLKRVKTDKSDAETLTEMIRIHVGQSNRYTLVTPEEMGAIDEELKRQLSGGCEESSCIAEIGGALGARFMITGKFSALGSRYLLLLKLVDIEQVKAENTASIQSDSIEDVVDQLSNQIPRLLDAVQSARTYAYDTDEAQTPKLNSGGIKEAFSSAYLEGAPSNAKVRIKGPDGVDRRDLSMGDKLSPLPAGRYRWKAEAPGFEAGGGSFDLKIDEVKTVRIQLRRLSQLTVRGEPKRSKVVIKGPGFERTVGIGSTLKDLPIGSYEVQVSKGGFEPETHALELKEGSRETLVVLLERPGNLVIEGTPVGAVVELSGPEGFEARDGLPLTVSGARRGLYKVRISRSGYQSLEKQVRVEPEKTAKFTVMLKRGRDGPYGEVPLDTLTTFRKLRRRCMSIISWPITNRDRNRFPDCDSVLALMKKYPILRCAMPITNTSSKRLHKTIENLKFGWRFGVGMGIVSSALIALPYYHNAPIQGYFLGGSGALISVMSIGISIASWSDLKRMEWEFDNPVEAHWWRCLPSQGDPNR